MNPDLSVRATSLVTDNIAVFLFLCLSVYALVHLIRKVLEGASTKLAVSRVWRNTVLPIMPLIIGGCLGLFKQTFGWPAFITTTVGRVLFGIICGLASTFVFGRIRALVKDSKSELP